MNNGDPRATRSAIVAAARELFGEHGYDGTSIDFMTSDKATGDAIAQFLLANAAALNLYDVIWWQQIWTDQRSSEGWRFYGDYGSATAEQKTLDFLDRFVLDERHTRHRGTQLVHAVLGHDRLMGCRVRNGATSSASARCVRWYAITAAAIGAA